MKKTIDRQNNNHPNRIFFIKKHGNRILSCFYNPQPVHLLLCFFIYYGIALGSIIVRYDFNFSSLVHFGHYYIEQNQDLTPRGAIRYTGNEAHGGNGYDGQIFYYYARSFFEKDRWPAGFNMAYRAPRIGYPLLTAAIGFGNSWGVLIALIIVQCLLIPAGCFALFHILPVKLKYLSFFYLLSPFMLQSFTLLVSDGVMISLQVIGLFFYLRMRGGRGNIEELRASSGKIEKIAYHHVFFAFLAFSLALMTKESALFIFFPLGLLALKRGDKLRIILMLAILLPMIFWQLYLRQVHGMVPANFLRVFLTPFSGIADLCNNGLHLFLNLIANRSFSGLATLIKMGARFVLVALIPLALYAVFSGNYRKIIPFRAAIIFALLSVCFADYYYFWSVYENISRMFTPLILLVILLKIEDPGTRTKPFFALLSLLVVMVFIRTTFLTPSFPHDSYYPYNGPDYSDHAPRPGENK